ncbi:WecB/TagA/CpsF family glycosyltransferase [Terriglobus albidus]|uniref:WecB/TagA/CpsF family glycosyltransferase n=1 Tax=Terriglobus albidus TaxID=1592106 RepID=UPI0021E0434C|nr:WecB/TagA/CpsF family glycosyltransferase [Terriglobus albidus]
MSPDEHVALLRTVERISIFDIPICRISHKAATATLIHEAESPGQCVAVFTANADHAVRIQRDEAFRRAYQAADAIFADGMPLIWTSHLMGQPLPARVTGIDLFHSLCEKASERKLPCFLLGATQAVLEEAAVSLQTKYPSLILSGQCNGYFHDDEAVLRLIEEAHPAILFVALGSPKQEAWIAKYAPRLHCRIALAIGGTLDVEAGRVSRAPVPLQKIGMEWFWRLLLEPSRLWRRYLLECPRVLPLLWRDVLRARFPTSTYPIFEKIGQERKDRS